MSGDLKSPSRSIPSGTLYGILLTFVSYTLVITAMAASITRLTFYKNVNVVQDVNTSEVLVLLGEVATTSFSVLMGIVCVSIPLLPFHLRGPGRRHFSNVVNQFK